MPSNAVPDVTIKPKLDLTKPPALVDLLSFFENRYIGRVTSKTNVDIAMQ